GRLRMGRRSGEPLGSAPGGQQMVPESDLANALSVFSSHTSAATESDQDVGPLVLDQSGVRGHIRYSSSLFLWLARVFLSRVRIFLFDRAASGGRALDSRALHVRFRSGDVQLLRTDQSPSVEHGVSQRAP